MASRERGSNIAPHIMVLKCTSSQRHLIEECHEWLCAHNGVDRTLAILTQYIHLETTAAAWLILGRDVRENSVSCATCQKMDTRHDDVEIRFVYAATDEAYSSEQNN